MFRLKLRMSELSRLWELFRNPLFRKESRRLRR